MLPPKLVRWFVVATGAGLFLCIIVLALRQAPQSAFSSTADPCLKYPSMTTRHSRKHRRAVLYPILEAIPKKMAADSGGASSDQRRAWHDAILEGRCLISRSQDESLRVSIEKAEDVLATLIERSAAAVHPKESADPSAARGGGRRLGRWREAKLAAAQADAASSAATAAATLDAPGASSATRRVTRGLGVFAGADFPCDEHRDAFVGASWARNACLLKCERSVSSATSPRCTNAIRVCERLADCATIDINVEGTVATLKSETALSRRTSRVKHVAVTHARTGRAAGVDRKCADGTRTVKLHALNGRAACIFDCPKLNCALSRPRGSRSCGAHGSSLPAPPARLPDTLTAHFRPSALPCATQALTQWSSALTAPTVSGSRSPLVSRATQRSRGYDTSREAADFVLRIKLNRFIALTGRPR
jgi:hypothetical protein